MGLLENIKSYSENITLDSEKKQILNSFFETGFPTIKNEEWKYTSLKKIISGNFSVEKDEDLDFNTVLDSFSLKFKNKIVFVNGKLVFFNNINGVNISAFTNFKTKNKNPLSKLNYALSTKGFSINIDANKIIDDPIEILFFTNTKNDNFSQYRNQIIVGKNSQVKFVEKIQSLNAVKSFTNHFTQITLNENANCEYNKIQNDTDNSILIDNLDVLQESNSACNVNTLIFGGIFIRNNLNFEQNGSNAESNMAGISVLNNTQFADNHTFVDHTVANCRSNELYKGVYLDNAKGVFNGKIMVRPNAQKIDAFQANNNLLLSNTSTIDTKPQLEIYADDVKCSHGCTIGQLDKNALFYMKSRGIAEKEAKAVLTYAFASESINQITIPEVKLLVQKLLSKKLTVDLDFEL